MKKILSIIITGLLFIPISAQNNEGKRVEFQFKERVKFYTVDDQYNLIKDVIYHADDGFRVYSGYDVETSSDGKEYIIFRYPKWRESIQESEKPKASQENMLLLTFFLDSINHLYSDDTLRRKIYLEILDSLTVLSEDVMNRKPYHKYIKGYNGLQLAMDKSDFDRLTLEDKVVDVYSLKIKHSTSVASGFMTIPFKLRPKQDSVNFNMTTDITLGAYVGVKKRISRKDNFFIVIPATLGLSYINVGNSETSNVNTENNSSVVPGWTWSSGVVIDLNGFNIGFVFGQDYASGVGNDWLYNQQLWYSFSIGYSFFNNKDK